MMNTLSMVELLVTTVFMMITACCVCILCLQGEERLRADCATDSNFRQSSGLLILC